jgi:hypothetical protein
LELGLLQLELGRRPDGRTTLARLADNLDPKTAPELLRFSRASAALAELAVDGPNVRPRSKTPRSAARGWATDAEGPEIEIIFGQIFLDANNPPRRQVVPGTPRTGRRSSGGARRVRDSVARDRNPPAAREAVAHALKINPNYEAAHLLTATSRSTTVAGRMRRTRSPAR